MGADRYSTCPRCHNRKTNRVEMNKARLHDAYGNLPLPEFDKLRAKIEEFASTPLPVELRENWEFVPPIDDGELRIVYRAACGTCGLTSEIDETRQLWSADELEKGPF